MAVQDDHMIRNIQDVGRLIAKLLLHEQQPDYRLPENEEDYTEADKLFSTIMKLAEEGKINEAEASRSVFLRPEYFLSYDHPVLP